MELRALLIGLGARGREWARELNAHNAWTLAAVVEPDPEALRLAAAFDVAPERCHPMLQGDLDDIDAVLIATPPDAHLEPALWAIEARRPLMVEKPFATSLVDARRIVAGADAAGVPVVVGQNHRYLRSHRTVRQVIDQGRLGDVRMATAHYYRVPHDMAASLARLPHRVLWGMGVHHLDALRYVLGRDATGVFARSYTLPPGNPPEGATFDALLEFEGGLRAQYTATYESSGHEYFEGGQEFYERIVGDKATLHVIHRWLVLCEGARLPRIIRRGKRESSEEAVLLSQFAHAVVDGKEPECSGHDNLKSMAIMEACIRSAADRSWIDPRELLDEPY
ncbi:MAG: Gfo/Idh/MocA family protein [Actinomycetota bacterium]